MTDKDRTMELLQQINAGFSNRCIELVRAGRSDKAARLHALHQRCAVLIRDWTAKERLANGNEVQHG